MQSKIDGMIHHMSNSQQQMARVLDAERQMAAHMAQIIDQLPDSKLEFEDITTIINHTREVNKSIISYLFGLADLEEALATNLHHVIKELENQDSQVSHGEE